MNKLIVALLILMLVGASLEAQQTKRRRLVKRAYRTYVVGKRGGCYYLNGSGKKTYVARKLCQK